MPKRLAIVVSGAVSLGSFEAGVLYEVIDAIGQHNQDLATPPQNKIYIDVLTGASAGGMTATIAAQKLLFEAGALSGAYSNAFYLPWVVDVNIDGLLTGDGDDDPEKSIFSSDFVTGISQRYLTQRYQSHADVPRNPHPALEPTLAGGQPKTLYLGLALANLNGVDYRRSILPPNPDGSPNNFIYTRHQDELVTSFSIPSQTPPSGPIPKDPDDAFDVWDPLRNAAVSCGAFPFAFRPVDVVRHDFEYKPPYSNLTNLETPILPVQLFTYTDGGTFQNEPLGLAKNLVDGIDHHLDVDNRYYLFVSPHSKGSSATNTAEFNAGNATLRRFASQLIGAIFEQSQFQDWITAQTVNDQIALFNYRAMQLHNGMVRSDSGNLVQSLQATAKLLLPTLMPAQNDIDAARARLQKQFQQEYDQLPDATKQTWIDAILVLETAANLGDKDEMTIYGITATAAELASCEISAFAGFFDRTYRDHDYNVGRTKAQKFLQSPGVFGLGAPIKYKAEPINEIDSKLDGLKLEDMDTGVRTNIRDRLLDRTKELLRQFNVNGLIIDGVALFFIKPQLNALLKL